MNERNINCNTSPLIGIGSDQGTKYATSEPTSKEPSEPDIFRYTSNQIQDTFTLPVRPNWSAVPEHVAEHKPDGRECTQQRKELKPKVISAERVRPQPTAPYGTGGKDIYKVDRRKFLLDTPFFNWCYRYYNSISTTINNYLNHHKK